MSVTRVLLYEFVTGGGCWSLPDAPVPGGSLLAEGAAMLRAVAEDLLVVDGVELHVLADARLSRFWPNGCLTHPVESQEDERRVLLQTAAVSDIALVIAPEFDGLLQARCNWVAGAGSNLLSPDETFVALSADKSQLAAHLATAGIPVPRAVDLLASQTPPNGFPFPAVLKPLDGAGSLDVHLLISPSDLTAFQSARPSWRLEAFRAGVPASVSILCGPRQHLVLQPGRQLLSSDGKLRYLGSAWPLSCDRRQRAESLATRAISAMPPTLGYIGIDLVLGAAANGSDDVVVEINPRLTTSYVGLRKLAGTNLADAMLRVARGLPTTVSWLEKSVTYYVDEASTGDLACTG